MLSAIISEYFSSDVPCGRKTRYPRMCAPLGVMIGQPKRSAIQTGKATVFS
jgi:hypothetical protein